MYSYPPGAQQNQPQYPQQGFQQNLQQQPNMPQYQQQYNQQGSQGLQDEVKYYQQQFLKHEAFAEHYARQKMANASNDVEYYQYAELEYFHKSRALHYKGLFNAGSTLIDNDEFS